MQEFIDASRGDWRQQEVNEQQRYEKEIKMGFKVSAKGDGAGFEQPPVGMHIARCIKVVDLGTQKVEWQGKAKLQRKGFIGWELLGDQRMADGRPFMTSKRYTMSLSEKAALRADLESWRGRSFTAAELEGFDLKNVLGKPCMLNLVTSDDGKYVNIKAITPLPASLTAPQAENETVLFSLDDFEQDVFDSLGDKVKATIMLSPEYQAIVNPGDAHAGQSDPDDDEIPF